MIKSKREREIDTEIMIHRDAMQLLFYGILLALLRLEKPEIKLEREK